MRSLKMLDLKQLGYSLFTKKHLINNEEQLLFSLKKGKDLPGDIARTAMVMTANGFIAALLVK